MAWDGFCSRISIEYLGVEAGAGGRSRSFGLGVAEPGFLSGFLGEPSGAWGTMHRAKGLEFDEVVLLLDERREALGSADTDRRRLHYVAITRAKKLATVIRVG